MAANSVAGSKMPRFYTKCRSVNRSTSHNHDGVPGANATEFDGATAHESDLPKRRLGPISEWPTIHAEPPSGSSEGIYVNLTALY